MTLTATGAGSPAPQRGHSVWWWIGLAGGLIAAFIVVLVLFVIIGHAAGVPIFAANDLVLLLTVLAGLMGSVFVVGGLIVALVAVVEALTVRERIKAVLDEHDHKLDQRFADQQAQLHAQADRHIEGYIALLRVEDAPDWPTAEALTQEALDLYPGLPRARSTLGLLMADHVIRDFTTVHGRIDPFLEINVPLGRAPLSRAISWLERALDHSDDPEGRTMAGLVLMYGANGVDDYDRMSAMLKRVSMAAPPERLADLREPQALSMLAYGCGNDETRLRELGETLALDPPLPLHVSSIVAAATELVFPPPDASRPYSPHLLCYVMGRPSKWKMNTHRLFPVVVQILLSEDAQKGRLGQPTLPGGPLSEHEEVFTTSEAKPVAEVAATLDALFLFVALIERP